MSETILMTFIHHNGGYRDQGDRTGLPDGYPVGRTKFEFLALGGSILFYFLSAPARRLRGFANRSL
jgi:hypothetical protein